MTYGQHLTTLIDARAAQIHYEDGMRRHLGGSVISRKCLREVWFSFRWAAAEDIPGRIYRLFQRGHREETVVTELLRSVGAKVWTHDEKGEQYKVTTLDGHGGGALDGVAINLPDLPPPLTLDTPVLLEIKTHNDKFFKQLQKHGVHKSFRKHWSQAQFYMHGTGIGHTLYCAVNKNDDSLHFELFAYDPQHGHYLLNRGRTVIYGRGMPPRISEDPSWFECSFCAMRGVCFHYTKAAFNCRTCQHASPQPDGTWACALGQAEIYTAPKVGCLMHQYLPGL